MDPPDGYYNWYAVVNARVRNVREVLQGDLLALQAVPRCAARKSLDFDQELKSARRDYQVAQRRATTLDRQVIRRLNRKLLQKAIDERIAGQPGISVALDNHETFRHAVRPHDPEPKSECQRQSAALLLDDADVWLEMVAEARLWGSDKTRILHADQRIVRGFPGIVEGARAREKRSRRRSPRIRRGSRGTPEGLRDSGEREKVAKKIAEVTPKFRQVLASMKENLRPLRWQLGISGKAADGKLISHLSPSEPQHKSELFPLPGPLSMKIVNIHQDFTFLPGVGDRETASADWKTGHALYIAAESFVGVAASSESELESLKANHTEDPTIFFSSDAPKDSRGVPLVDVEIWEGNTLFSNFTVHAGDIYGIRSGLNWLTGVIHNAAARDKLASMAADIEMFAHAILIAASLFPPTALAVTAAETLAFLAQILGDPEFKEAMESIAKDPIESIEHAANEAQGPLHDRQIFSTSCLMETSSRIASSARQRYAAENARTS